MSLTKLKSKISTIYRPQGEIDSPKKIRTRQLFYLGGGGVLMFSCLWTFFKGFQLEKSSSSKTETSITKTVATLTTPLETVDEREIWINKVEQKTEAVREESQALRKENEFIKKKVDVIEELLNNAQSNIVPYSMTEGPSVANGGIRTVPSSGQVSPQQLVQQPATQSPVTEENVPSFSSATVDGKKIKKKGSKIAHIKGTMSGVVYKTKDTHMPAGSYVKAVITGGAVVSTASSTQSNPEPITLRLVDDGILPRGFKGRIKDAEVNASCYGALSSERAKCRLETISWVETDGQVVQKNLTGWIFGEDGRNGLRGQVVDRSTEVAKKAFAAGLLSATSQFFKMESAKSAFPIAPFGQTNALSNKDALQGAVASGVSNAFDKIADFSIKRAEQMQPVIVISAGRIVDLRLKEMLSLISDEEETLKPVTPQTQNEDEGGE